MSIRPQHNLSELIAILETVKDQFGDLPVVYFDQGITFTFDDFADQVLTITEDNNLYFGDFHNNSSKVHRDDLHVSETVTGSLQVTQTCYDF